MGQRVSYLTIVTRIAILGTIAIRYKTMVEQRDRQPQPELSVQFEGRTLRIPQVDIDPESVTSVSRWTTEEVLEILGRSKGGERMMLATFCFTEEEAQLQVLHALKDDVDNKQRKNWKTGIAQPPLATPADTYVEVGATPHRLGPTYLAAGLAIPKLHPDLIGIWRPIPEDYQAPEVAIYTPSQSPRQR